MIWFLSPEVDQLVQDDLAPVLADALESAITTTPEEPR